MKITFKNFLTWTAVFLLLPFRVLADSIDESEARQRALAFLQQRGADSPTLSVGMAAKSRMPKAQSDVCDYYVFNVNGGGFVVVSGDDRTASILGYADGGTLDEANIPDGLRYLLDGYSQQIAWLEENGCAESDDNDSDVDKGRRAVRKSAAARSAIAPMLETRWNQFAPYNAFCPKVGEELTATGCVATSMAQLMYYHKYPMDACTSIPGYTTETRKISVGALDATTFSWNDMTPTYGSALDGYPEVMTTAETAVAKLMQYCGVALEMDYDVVSAGGSSSYSNAIVKALAYFGYGTTVTYVERYHYSYQEWVELIYSELAKGRPVALGGQSCGGGHSFVCDGYDADDYFHINWGWSGQSDGYFRLSLLNPDEQGEGGSSSLDGFSFSQDAVVGIQPPGGLEPSPINPISTSVMPSAATIVVSGDMIKGHEQDVTVCITGGDGDYHGNVVLRVNGKAVMGRALDIPAGKTVDAHFSYIPTAAGDNTLTLWNYRSGGTQIGSSEIVTITESNATNTQEITVSPVIANLGGDGKLYGNALRVTATVSNPSSEHSYASRLNCSLREFNSDNEAEKYSNATVQRKNIIISEGGTINVTFEYTGLERGKFYCLRFTYTQGYDDNGVAKTRTQEACVTSRYEMGEGYMTYNPDGTTTICPVAASISAGDARCIDLTGLAMVPDVTPSSNPNCVYIIANGASAPASLYGCNIVRDGAADNLALTDGYDFYTPVDFTAATASYTRTFTTAANGSSGWNTLLLPFKATSVTCEGMGAVDWFHSDTDEDKNFWLRAFTADDEGTVTFDYADEDYIAANTPYIIAVPDDRWGTEWQMTGKAVTFSGTDVSISASESEGLASVSGNHYRYCGTTNETSVSDVYLLNAKGSKFVKATTPTDVPAFRAWFVPVSISSLNRTSLSIVSPAVTGICVVTNEGGDVTDDNWYGLDGRRLIGKPVVRGTYISKGKKFMIR